MLCLNSNDFLDSFDWIKFIFFARNSFKKKKHNIKYRPDKGEPDAKWIHYYKVSFLIKERVKEFQNKTVV